MRYLVISDLHSNIEALDAVLADAARHGFDQAVCLGDLVGYGASPNPVVDRVRELSPIIIRGNHDKVISGIESGDQFNHLALQSCHWTQENLSAENLDFLRGLPRGPVQVDGEVWLAHGTPLDEDAYILSDLDAAEVFRGFPGQICFFGHSHLPTVFGLGNDIGLFLLTPMDDAESLPLKPGCRYLINCGSVGQPRDRNPKAAYGIYDTGRRTLHVHRVRYDVAGAQRKILSTRLPHFLAERLAHGA